MVGQTLFNTFYCFLFSFQILSQNEVLNGQQWNEKKKKKIKKEKLDLSTFENLEGHLFHQHFGELIRGTVILGLPHYWGKHLWSLLLSNSVYIDKNVSGFSRVSEDVIESVGSINSSAFTFWIIYTHYTMLSYTS